VSWLRTLWIVRSMKRPWLSEGVMMETAGTSTAGDGLEVRPTSRDLAAEDAEHCARDSLGIVEPG
jgi:hypothetical protein